MSETTTESVSLPSPTEDPSVLGLFNTTDHKRIGRMFIFATVLIAAGAVVLESLLRIDLSDPDAYVLFDSKTYTQSFLLARDALVFLFIIPFFVGIALYVVPLQVGAAGLVFTRAALASFWTWLISSVILVGAYVGNGGSFGGNSDSVDLYILSLGFVIASLLVGVVTVVVTALTVRAPGLSIASMPAFTWSIVVWGVGLLLTLPVLLANLVFLYVDHRYGRLFLGGNFGIWDHIEWAYRAPQLFLYIVPALGLVAEILVGSSRRVAVVPSAITAGLGALALFGMGAWAQLNIAEGVDVTNGWPGVVYAATFVAALVAILAVVAVSFATLGAGERFSPLSTPVLAAVAISLVALLGAAQGAVGAFLDWAESLGWFSVDPVRPLRNTTWTSAQFQLFVIGVGLLSVIGALSWWVPKIWGRSLNAVIGRTCVGLVFIGSLLAALGTSLAGLLTGQPELARFGGLIDPLRGGIYGFIQDASGGLNVLSLIGMLLVGLAAVLVVLDLGVSILARKGAECDNDPWDASSPEWLLASPPPLGPLTDLPDLDSGAPGLDVATQELEEALP